MKNTRGMKSYSWLVIPALLLAACAGDGKKIDGAVLAAIQIEKTVATSAADCPMTLSITNHTDRTWDGASYHVSMLNSQGKAIGRLMGAPRRTAKAGQVLADSGKALGAKCQEIAAVQLVYFGYYPAGKTQVNLHYHQVRVGLK